MKSIHRNQRGTAFGLLVSLLLQSCGVGQPNPTICDLDHITSTKELVEAWNNAQIPQEQHPQLRAWVYAYVDCFRRLDLVRDLDLSSSIKYLNEYKDLSRLKFDLEDGMQGYHQSYFQNIYDHIVVHNSASGSKRESNFMKMLVAVLQSMDPNLLDVNDLLTLLVNLLDRIDTADTTFTATTYPSHAPKLEAIYELLRVIRLLDPEPWAARKQRQAQGAMLYGRVQQRLQSISQSLTGYYPVHYHVHLLSEALAQYEEPLSVLDKAKEGMQGTLALLSFVASLSDLKGACEGICGIASLSIDVFEKINEILNARRDVRDDIGLAFDHFKEMFRLHATERPYYNYHQALSLSSNLALGERDAAKAQVYFDDFVSYVDRVEMSTALRLADIKALRYFMIRQFTLLSLHHRDLSIRHRSISKLSELVDPWLKKKVDQAIMHEALDGLALICRQSQDDTDKILAETNLDRLVQSSSEYTPSASPLARLPCFAYSVPQPVMCSWLGDNRTVQEKLSSFRSPVPNSIADSGILLSQAKEQSRLYAGSIRSVSQIPTVLKLHYQQHHFTEMAPFLGEVSMSVEAIECHLKLNEQKKIEEKENQNQLAKPEERLQWVKTPIHLEDLFKPKSLKPDGPAKDLKPDGPAKEINRVLLVGEAGTGKTSLTKKIAHAWTQPETTWSKNFTVIYILPVRALRADRYNNNGHFCRHESLATAIANECFTGMKDESDFQKLHECVKVSLTQPTTLVILDGLDERHGTSEALINEAKAGKHKLLLTSRPYGIATERGLVDIEVDHMGLDEKQRDRFIDHAFTDTTQATGLISFIKGQDMQNMASVPVNLKILCTLWKRNRDELDKPGISIGLSALYRQLVNHVWERFEIETGKQGMPQQLTRPYRDDTMDQTAVFKDLELIALSSLQVGKLIIDKDTIRGILGNRRPSHLLEDAGFLLFQQVDQQYQFPHLTFQEYFAGRRLARLFLSSDKHDQEEVVDFVRTHMYVPRYRRTISFMSGEISKGMTQEMNVRGNSIVHVEKLLSLVPVPQEILGLQNLALRLRLINEWLLTANGNKREVAHGLEKRFKLSENLEMWLKKSMSQYDSDVRSTQVLHRALLALLSEVSGVTKHYIDKLLPHIRIALEDNDYNLRLSAVESLRLLVEKGAPLDQIFPHIQQALGDSNDYARGSAVESLPLLLENGAPLEQLFPHIQKALGDSDNSVRRSAVESLWLLLEKGAPLEQIFPHIQKALGDSNDYVRGSAVASLPLLLEKGAPLEQIFPHIQKALGDSNDYARSSAVASLPLLVEKGATLGQIFPHIQKALGDSDYDVRGSAVVSLRLLVEKGAPLGQIFPHIQKALGDSNDYARGSAVASLQLLLENGAPLEQLFPHIQKALGDSDNSVRRSAVESLWLLLEKGAPLEQIFPHIQKALGDSDYDVRDSAVESLHAFIEKGDNAVDTLAHVQKILERRSYNFSSSLRAAFETYSTEFMINYYWQTKDESIMPFLIPRLYEAALTIEDTGDSDQQRLILYPSIGDPIEPIEELVSKEDVSQFQQLIQNTGRYFKD